MLFGGLAVLSVSLSGAIPENLSIGMHATRIEGGNANQLREQVAYLMDQQGQLERGSDELQSQVRLTERDQGEMVRRLSALETAIPALLESVPPDVEIDQSIATGSVDDATNNFDVDGGSVSVLQRPLFHDNSETDSGDVPEPLPELPPSLDNILPEQIFEPDTDEDAILTATEYGLAIGSIVTDDSAQGLWAELQDSIGTLLIGLEPALSDPAGTGDSRIIVGPISDYAEAETLCLRIARAGVPCLPVQYAGNDLLELSALEATN